MLDVSITGWVIATATRYSLHPSHPHALTSSHTHALTPSHPQACRVPSCGYDAGDCGTELWETLYSVVPRPNQTHSIPLGTTAMFFNLTKYFTNGTISSAEHGPCPVVRTAVLAQTFKTLSLTFSKNSSVCVTTVTVNGTTGSGAVVTVGPSHSTHTGHPIFLSPAADLCTLGRYGHTE